MQVQRHSRLSCKQKVPECVHAMPERKWQQGCGRRGPGVRDLSVCMLCLRGMCNRVVGVVVRRLSGVSGRRTSRVSTGVPGVSAGVSGGFPWVSKGFRQPRHQKCVYGKLRFLEVLAKSMGFPPACAWPYYNIIILQEPVDVLGMWAPDSCGPQVRPHAPA